MPDIERLNKLLERELKARGIRLVERTEDGQLVLEFKGATLNVSVDELLYDFDRDADPLLVVRFVSDLIDEPRPLPAWKQARKRLFFAAEPRPDEKDDLLVVRVTDSLRLVITHADEDERILTPVSGAALAAWNVTAKDVLQAVRANMGNLLEETTLEVRKIGTINVGTFVTRSVFKPGLLFSPNFKQTVAPKLGWPVLACLPCREMVYVLPVDALDSQNKETIRFRSFLVHEFMESRYGLTVEMLLIADEGVKPAGFIGPPGFLGN